ncbi:MAG: CAP domain-containing protein [Actinomycetes bacterium]
MRFPTLLSAFLLALAVSAPIASADPSACPNSQQVATSPADPQARATMLCLVNAERANVGAVALKSNALLGRAATAYAARLVTERFFNHTDPSGGKLTGRVLSSGYLNGADLWLIGENLAWGSGSLGSPAKIVAAWMASPGHRANLLRREFREIGIGVAPGTPGGATGGATHAEIYASRTTKVTQPTRRPVHKPAKNNKRHKR